MKKAILILGLGVSFLNGMDDVRIKKLEDMVEAYDGSQEGFTRVHACGEYSFQERSLVHKVLSIFSDSERFLWSLILKNRNKKEDGSIGIKEVDEKGFTFLVKNGIPYGWVALNSRVVFLNALPGFESESQNGSCFGRNCPEDHAAISNFTFRYNRILGFRLEHMKEVSTNGESILFQDYDGNIYRVNSEQVRRFMRIPNPFGAKSAAKRS